MICCARLLLLGVVSLLLFLLDLGFISLPGSAVLWPGQKATAPVKGLWAAGLKVQGHVW